MRKIKQYAYSSIALRMIIGDTYGQLIFPEKPTSERFRRKRLARKTTWEMKH